MQIMSNSAYYQNNVKVYFTIVNIVLWSYNHDTISLTKQFNRHHWTPNIQSNKKQIKVDLTSSLIIRKYIILLEKLPIVILFGVIYWLWMVAWDIIVTSSISLEIQFLALVSRQIVVFLFNLVATS